MKAERVRLNLDGGLNLEPGAYGFAGDGKFWVQPPVGDARVIDRARATLHVVGKARGTATVAGEIPGSPGGRAWRLTQGNWTRV